MITEDFYKLKKYPIFDKYDKKANHFTYYDICEFAEEYYEFKKWMDERGWYESSEREYDNFIDPNSCIKLNLDELYKEFLKDKI